MWKLLSWDPIANLQTVHISIPVLSLLRNLVIHGPVNTTWSVSRFLIVAHLYRFCLFEPQCSRSSMFDLMAFSLRFDASAAVFNWLLSGSVALNSSWPHRHTTIQWLNHLSSFNTVLDFPLPSDQDYWKKWLTIKWTLQISFCKTSLDCLSVYYTLYLYKCT